MSISSYRRNVKAGVTGKYKPTCYPSALEQISPSNELCPSNYVSYSRGVGTVERLYREGGSARRQINPFMKKLLGNMFEQLGCELDDVEFRRVKNAYNLKRLVKSVLNEGCRVTLDIDMKIKDESHAVGLLELVDGRFELMSNHIPYGLKIAKLDEIFPFMEQSKNKHSERYTFADSNVTILPPSN